MVLRYVTLVFVVLALVACAAPGPPSGGGFAFGVWGDMPYNKSGDSATLPAVLQSMNRADIAFSIYDGDIKDGSSRCTDEVYTDALSMFGSMVKPAVYVPGDNEWTDCHRLNNGGFDTLERLNHIRRVMYPTILSLGQTPMALEHQGKLGEQFVENTRFTHGGVVFVGINMPGSNNNVVLNEQECKANSARTSAQCAAANAEYAARDSANRLWLADSFARAKAQNAIGLVLVVQADPGFDVPETVGLDESAAPGVSGYRNFMNALVQQTEQFAGQVLLVHGDAHYFKVDKPLYSPSRLLPNLTRLQTFGSPAMHWVRIKVEPQTQHVFEIQPVVVRQP